MLGLDGAYVRAWGGVRPVLVAVDLGEGKPVAIGCVDEFNPQAVRRFLEPLVKRLGVSVIVTDDLVHYKTVAHKLDLEHQICQFHVRRWVGRTLQELRRTVPEEWLWMNFPSPFELHDYRYLGENFRERERIKRKKERWVSRLSRMDALERHALISAVGELRSYLAVSDAAADPSKIACLTSLSFDPAIQASIAESDEHAGSRSR